VTKNDARQTARESDFQSRQWKNVSHFFSMFALPALANLAVDLVAVTTGAACVVDGVRNADFIPASRGRGCAGVGAAHSCCLHCHEEG
jgi:hypothetical protein